MRFRVLLAPELNQQWGPVLHHNQRPGHHRMMLQAKRDHQVKFRATRYPVMHRKRALPATRRIAYPAAPPVPVEHRFPQPGEVFYILPPECVADRAQSSCYNLRASTRAVHDLLDRVLHGLEGNFLADPDVRSHPAFFPRLCRLCCIKQAQRGWPLG